MTTEQSTVPPPNTTLDKGQRRGSSDGRPSLWKGTVVAAARPLLHRHRSKHETPMPAVAGRAIAQQSIGAEQAADQRSASGRFGASVSIGQGQWESLTRIFGRDVKYADGLGRTQPMSSTHAAVMDQGRTPRLIAATSSATFDTDSVMPSSRAMATASRNGITRRSKNSSSSEARGSAARSSPM